VLATVLTVKDDMKSCSMLCQTIFYPRAVLEVEDSPRGPHP